LGITYSLYSLSISFSERPNVNQELRHNILLAESAVNEFLCFLITKEALENNLSDGVEVVVMLKMSLAILEMC
ncbi:hypothetical protein, partial [Bartonella sp. CL9QHWL]|uniref:hypothetical protein n=1 Tax=Bartonella sp. CL9QHWL TaxID=3243542 RepID=UPI0035CF23C3